MVAPSTSLSRRGENDYYEVLGVPFEATEEDIRKTYHSLVRTLHPDRRRPGGGGGAALDRFHLVQSAWRCLSDPTRRLLYDLRNFGRSSVDQPSPSEFDPDASRRASEVKLIALQKEQALLDVRNMQVLLEKVRRREMKKGVIVKKALYGDLRLREECFEAALSGISTIDDTDLVGPLIDVAVPLQCLVEKHTLVLPGGASASKADLPGFYNPMPQDLEAELSLYVLYDFQGNQHEVIVGDHETLSMPQRKHLIPPDKAPRGPFSAANVALLQQRRFSGARDRAASASAGSLQQRIAGSRQSFDREVSGYRFAWLRQRTLGDGLASPEEFLAVSVGLGLAIALVLRLSR